MKHSLVMIAVLALAAEACAASKPNEAALEQVYLGCDAQVLGYQSTRDCIKAHIALSAADVPVTVESVIKEMNK